jgi:hypothetical protein
MPDGTPYPTDIKAEAVALVKVDGLSLPQAAARLAEMYPDRAPAFQTVSVWCSQDSDLGSLGRERMRDLWADAIAVNHKLAERAEEAVATLKGQQAFISWGIGQDKEVKLIEALTGPKPTGGVQVQNVIIVVNADKPEQVEAIEGEARDVTDAEDR